MAPSNLTDVCALDSMGAQEWLLREENSRSLGALCTDIVKPDRSEDTSFIGWIMTHTSYLLQANV